MALGTNLIAKYEREMLQPWVRAGRLFEAVEFKLSRLRLFFVRLIRIIWLIVSLVANRHLPNEQKFRKFFEQSSGAFIKFGQILSMRHDLLPARYTNELLHLLSQVEELPFNQMEKVFLAELGHPPHDFFLDFDPRPIASASISQVYKATLKSGALVVVKIQRPDIRAIFETDFILARLLSGALNLLGLFHSISTKQVVDDFIDWTKRELDFTNELQNAMRFYNHSALYPQTIIPKVYPEYSTIRVLIMEYINLPFSAEEMLRQIETNPAHRSVLKQEYNIDTKELAYYFVKDGLRQFLIDGLFHADPHPANLFFLPDDKLGYFDFGIVGSIGGDRLPILKILYGICQKDFRFVSKNLMAFTKEAIDREIDIFRKHDPTVFDRYAKAIAKVEEILIDEIALELESILAPIYNKKSALRGSISLLRLLIKAEEYGLYLPRNVAIFFRSLIITDMVAVKLDPEFDTVSAISRFFADRPLAETEKLILASTSAEAAVAEDEFSPPLGLSYEELLELKAREREELNNTLEHLIDLASFYAEHYDEVRKLLKNGK